MFGKLKSPKFLILALLSALVLAGALLFGAYQYVGQSQTFASSDIVVINKGKGAIQIASQLEREGVVSSALLLRFYLELSGNKHALKAGAYHFDVSTVSDVVAMLVAGKTVSYQVTIPEGLRSHEVIDILRQAPHVSGDFDTLTFDEKFYYLPETYRYEYNESVHDILKRMNKMAHDVLDAAWEARDPMLPIKNKMELMTLASIIEKETAVASERKRVSGVFVNRLNKGMRLQTDPTVIYGATNYNGNITRKHLREEHPYNTYVIKGLPPGPICHPGADAIWAAAQPEVHDYFYFVADGYGGHTFAKTHVDHVRNVKTYLEIYRNKYK